MAPKKKPEAPAKPAAAAKKAAPPKAAAKAAAPKKAPKKAAEEGQKKGKKQGGGEGKPKKDYVTGVLIRNLDFAGMCNETVKELFKKCGDIHSVRLRHGKFTIVFFKSLASAQKLLEMDNKFIKGNKIKVMRCKRAKRPHDRERYCRTVWCGPLPGGTTKAQLRKHFASCGEIEKVRYYPSKKSGFVYFKEKEQAQKAVAMASVPFAHGKSAEELAKLEKVPKELQVKLQVKLSHRTLYKDKMRNERRYNRRPPSEIERKEQKSKARAALRAAAKEAEEKKQAEGGKKDSTTKKGSGTKKGSTTKKDSTTKKGSTTKKEGKKGSTTKK